MQYVVHPGIALGFLDAGNVGWFLNNANDPLIARRIGTKSAGVKLRNIVANGAKAQMRFKIANGLRQRDGILLLRAQQMKGKPLRAFSSNAGKFAQFVDQTG